MLFGGFVDTFCIGLLRFFRSLFEFFFYPLNELVNSYLSGVSECISFAAGYLHKIYDVLPFCLSYLGFYPDVIAFCVLLIIAIVTIPFAAHTTKLILRWYRMLMP